MSAYYTSSSVTIATSVSTTVSAEVDLRGQMLLMVQTPAALTGTTLSFQVADQPGGTFVPVKHLSTLAATAFTITSVGTSMAIVIDSSLVPQGIGNCILKLVSGSAESADRTFTLFTRAL